MSLTSTSLLTKSNIFPEENSYYLIAQKKKQNNKEKFPKQKPEENIKEVLKAEGKASKIDQNDSINKTRTSSPRFAMTQIFFEPQSENIARKTKPFMTENIFSDEKDIYSKFKSSLKKGVYNEEIFTRVNEWKPSLRKIDEPQGQQKEKRRVRRTVMGKNESNLGTVPESLVGPEIVEKNIRKRVQSPGVTEEYKKMAETRLLLPSERDDLLRPNSKKNYGSNVSHIFDNLQIGSFDEMNRSSGGKFRNDQNYSIHDGSTARNLVSYEFALPYREQNLTPKVNLSSPKLFSK